MASADLPDTIICSICLKNCEDPTRLTCGHNFCRECTDVLDALEEYGDYTCPECRVEFQEHPVLSKTQPQNEADGNFCTKHQVEPLTEASDTEKQKTSSVLDKLSKTKKATEERVEDLQEYLRGAQIKDDGNFCTEHQVELLTEASDKEKEKLSCFLEKLFKSRKATEEKVEDLQEYLRGAQNDDEDGNVCTEHQLELLTEASDKEKEELSSVLEKLSKSKKASEDRVEDLQQYLRGAHENVSGLTERVVALFTDTRRQLDALEHKILKDISNQEDQARASVCDLIHSLEIRIAKLSTDIKDMEELCNMTELLPVQSDIGDTEETLDQDSDLDVGLISAALHTALSDIVTSVKSRFYVKQSPDVVLDLSTASNDVYITGDLKSASASEFKERRTKLHERFQYSQVLSSRSFSSCRHFIEMETCPTGNWRIGMCYPSIAREGYHSLIGHSNKSWGLCRYLNQYFVVHNRKVVPVPHKPSSQRLGIFLDYKAGHIGFYELCDPITHLYTYSTKFNEALYLIVGVYTGWVRIKN